MYARLPFLSLLTASLACGAAHADTKFGERVTFRGFGTLGAVTTDNGDAEFVRDGSLAGAKNRINWNVDSKVGLQTDVKANDWITGTLQVLAEQRIEPDVKAKFEWAFVRLTPVEGLSVRVGRLSPSVFMVSDSRNVGYANTMVRMPNAVYSLNSLKTQTGIDASYRFKLGGQFLTLAANGGTGDIVTPNNERFDAKQVRGASALLETSLGSFRIATVKAKVDVPADITLGLLTDARVPYTFSSVAYQWDEADVIFNAEYVKRSISGMFSGIGAKGWYLMGGYRLGSWTPYVFAAQSDSKAQAIARRTSGNERAVGAGVRWDLVQGAALKLQAERVDPRDTGGTSFSTRSPLPISTTNVISATLDFVF